MAGVSLKFYLELSGRKQGWTDVTCDIHAPSGVEFSRGKRGNSPNDRVASTGIFTGALINSDLNVAGVEGYYSPGHASVRAGFARGIGLRVIAVIGGAEGWISPDWIESDWIEVSTPATEVTLWTGTITRIRPTSGKYLERLVYIEARDYINRLARHRLSGLSVEQGIGEADAFQAVSDAMPVAPRSTQITAGPDTYDYAFDLTRDGETTALREAQRIGSSSLSLIWVKGDGTLVYEPRTEIRADAENALTPEVQLVEADLRNRLPPSVDDDDAEIVNRVKTIVTPREVAAANVVLYTAVNPIEFAPGGPFTVLGPFTDPDQRTERIGAISLVAPVASTDYIFNSESDGSGTDLTSLVTVTATLSGNAVSFAVTNNSGQQAWATTLQARGLSVAAQERVTLDVSEGDGDAAIVLDMPYQSDLVTAHEIAQWLLHVLSQDQKRIRSIPLWLDPGDTDRALEIANLDISDVISFSETMTGYDGTERMFVNEITYRLLSDHSLWVDITPEPANSELLWLLGETGFTELGSVYLGFDTFPTFDADRHLTTGGSKAAATSYQTGTIEPLENYLVLAGFSYGRNDGVVSVAPTVSGCGLSWTKVTDFEFHVLGSARRSMALYWALATSPTRAKLTADFSAASQFVCSWTVSQHPDVGTTGLIVQNATASAGGVPSVTATLSSFADADNRPVMIAAYRGPTDTIEPEAGWTLLGRRSLESHILSAWIDSVDLTATAHIPGGYGETGIIAVEIKAA